MSLRNGIVYVNAERYRGSSQRSAFLQLQ